MNFFENFRYFENDVFKILFSFVKVGQNTSRINVQRFPNPKKLKMSQGKGGGGKGNEVHLGHPCGRQKWPLKL